MAQDGQALVRHVPTHPQGAIALTDIAGILQFALDGVTAEQAAISGNLANAQTPGYRAEDVSFQSSLAAAIANGGTATVAESPSTAPPATDGNNVSLTTELVTAEAATLQYQTLTESLNAQFRLVQGAAGGRFT